MKKLNFLGKLKHQAALELVDPSEEISKSYLIKSDKCAQVAALAFNAGIYENAISEAYYSIYNAVLALFYKCGIKCENHSAAVLLIKDLFVLNTLHPIFSQFKKERIDNQYYTPILNAEPVTKEKCDELLKTAQNFTLAIRTEMEKFTLEEIDKVRINFKKL